MSNATETITYIILNADCEDETMTWTGHRAQAIAAGRRALDNGHEVEDLPTGARCHDSASRETITVSWDDIAAIGAACLSGHAGSLNWAYIGEVE